MNKLRLNSLHTCPENHKTQMQGLANRFAVRFAKVESGFSLIEVLVVVLMIGVLAAILAPNWFRFVSRQRLNKANDAVIAAIQEAQRQAQKTKLRYSVSFTTDSSDKLAKVAIHPSTSAPDTYWRKLGKDVEIPSDSVLLGTNLSSQNTAGTSIKYDPYSSSNQQTITFDYAGILPSANFGTPTPPATEAPGLRIVLAIPSASNSTSPSSTKRCVIVKTLLGSVLTEKDDKCDL